MNQQVGIKEPITTDSEINQFVVLGVGDGHHMRLQRRSSSKKTKPLGEIP